MQTVQLDHYLEQKGPMDKVEESLEGVDNLYIYEYVCVCDGIEPRSPA